MRLSRRAFVQAAALTLPLLLQLLAFKAFKVASMTPGAEAWVDWSKSGQVALAAASIFAAITWLQRWGRSPGAAIAMVLVPIATCVVFLLLPRLPQARSTASTAIELMRGEIAFAVAYFVLCCILLQLAWGIARFGLSALTAVLMLLASLDVAFYRSTGSFGDWQLLAYAATHLRDASTAVLPEADRANGALLIAPLLLLAAAAFVPRLGPVRRWIEARPTIGARGLTTLALAALALVALPRLPVQAPYALHRGAVLVAGLHSLPDLVATTGTVARDVPPLFDTRALRFAARPERRPLNVILVQLESTGAGATTAYDPSLPTTPLLAELAREALIVEDFYVVVPHTTKALVAILCGIPPQIGTTMLESEALPGRCLPALLADHRYSTAVFTTGPLGFENNAALFREMGFGTIRGRRDVEGRGFAALDWVGLEDRAMLAPSLAWIDEVTRTGQPFFLTYVTVGGHHPYVVPSSYASQHLPTAVNDDQQRYFNALRQRDDFLREVVQGLDRRGLLDSTVLLVLGDHGEAFGEHGRFVHDDVPWDEVLRIPGILWIPPGGRGARIGGLRQQVDVLPTLAAALGFTVEGGHLPGYDLLAPVPADRRLYFGSWYGSWLGDRRGTRKRIYQRHPAMAMEYDLARDPLERENLARGPGDPTDLRQWAAAVNLLHRAR